MANPNTINFSDCVLSGSMALSGDTILLRDAANIYAQRNGAIAQEFRLYNTFTDAANYERATFKWLTNALLINAEFAGTGVQRNIGLQTAGGNVGIGTNNPGKLLHISGSNGPLKITSSDGFNILFENTGSGTVIYQGITSTADWNVNNTSGIALFTVKQNGNVGIGTTSPSNLLSLGGEVVRIVWMERRTAANVAGNTLTIQAGGATSGATDKAGGDLILSSGAATGAGSAGIQFQTATAGAAGIADRLAATTVQLNGAGQITKYANVAAVGWGVPAIYGQGRSVAQTAAIASVAAYTVGAADGTFIVSANVLVTTATTHNFTVTVAYTDEGNTARTLTLNFSQLAGTFVTAITNTTGAGPYEGVPLHIRCKASTAITIATTGTFTTVTYNVEGYIRQLG